MGSYPYRQINNPPCANCGKPGGGFMGSTAWEHDYRCCSNRCGLRLKKRIENGMFPDYHFSYDCSENEEKKQLRIRIKHLEKQLRLAGLKPKRPTTIEKNRECDLCQKCFEEETMWCCK